MACPVPTPGGNFLGDTLRFLDCEALAIGAAGYQALASPGSMLWALLTALLTISVAILGYRMILGEVPSVREGVLAFVKIGIVLTLATSWPAYRTIVFDVAVRGPAELSSTIGGGAGLPGSSGGMITRLEATDAAMVALAIEGTGLRSANLNAMPPLFAGFEPFALGGSRMLFLLGVLGAFGTVRLIAGLLLAIAPLFIAFLLFDATRGLFEGWLRVLLGAALGSLGTSILLGVQLALYEPWLTSLLNARAAGIAVPSAPVELLTMSLLFAILLLAVLAALARLAWGFGFARFVALQPVGATQTGRLSQNDRISGISAPASGADRSRAAMVADAVASGQRREASLGTLPMAGHPSQRVPVQAVARQEPSATITPLGQSHRRRTARHVSSSADRRDARA
ncbi:MAG: type IV secretion system protein [Blastomonas fulva]|uniref:type IV secretion system protein n=1 Tax=Blastomonas fulva TaxID=1550728 RepID=UPI0040340760